MSTLVTCSSDRIPFVPLAEPGSNAYAAPKWFAVYTTPRHEKRVEFHMHQRGIEHFLPIYRTHRKWSDGSRVVLNLPLFPGYIFAYIGRSERVRVLEVPGVLAIVGGTGHEPASLPEAEIEALRAGLEKHNAEPHTLVTVGERVCIRTGSFAGMTGFVVRLKGGLRVVLTLELIMQSVSLEIDACDLEMLGS